MSAEGVDESEGKGKDGRKGKRGEGGKRSAFVVHMALHVPRLDTIVRAIRGIVFFLETLKFDLRDR